MPFLISYKLGGEKINLEFNLLICKHREAIGRKDACHCVYLLKSPSLGKVSADYGTTKGISYILM